MIQSSSPFDFYYDYSICWQISGKAAWQINLLRMAPTDNVTCTEAIASWRPDGQGKAPWQPACPQIGSGSSFRQETAQSRGTAQGTHPPSDQNAQGQRSKLIWWYCQVMQPDDVEEKV